MVVRNWVISVDSAPADVGGLRVATYPNAGERNAYQDTVVKVFFSQPVRGVDDRSFILTDSHGVQVPAWVDQIGDGAWGLFPNSVTLKPGETYIARLKAGICGLAHDCTNRDTVWQFSVSKDAGQGTGDTSIPMGFTVPTIHGNTLAASNKRARPRGTKQTASRQALARE
jgi:hypothetical protein